MDFARYSIKTPVNIWLMVIICLIGGWIGLQNIGRLEDPAFTIKLAQVITHHPGASAAKVEKEVTEPLEIALQQMSQVYRLISKSKPGYSEITVEIKHHYDGKDLPQIWDEMRKNCAMQPQPYQRGRLSPTCMTNLVKCLVFITH